MVATVLIVCAACSSLNFRVLVTEEDGSVLNGSYYRPGPVRLHRSTGWPFGGLVRTNWATIVFGEAVFDEGMRPKESRVDLTAIAKNIAVAVVLSLTACILVSAGYRRQFTLRSVFILTLCVAILTALLGPYVKAEFDRHEQNRILEILGEPAYSLIPGIAVPNCIEDNKAVNRSDGLQFFGTQTLLAVARLRQAFGTAVGTPRLKCHPDQRNCSRQPQALMPHAFFRFGSGC